MTLKEFADDVGLHYVGNDFDSLSKSCGIKDFFIGTIKVSRNGFYIEISLYESEDLHTLFAIKFNVSKLMDLDYYTALDKRGIKELGENQYKKRMRLRIQSALLDLYREKDGKKGFYKDWAFVELELTPDGRLIWPKR